MVALLSCLSLQDIQISQRVFVTHSGKGCESGILWMFQMTRIQMRRAQCRHGVGGLFAHSCQQSRVFDRTGAPAMCCKSKKRIAFTILSTCVISHFTQFRKY